MENVNELNQDHTFGAPRCKECNKLFKKSEANEASLCPTCLSKASEPEGQGSNEKMPEISDKTNHTETNTVRPGQAIRDKFYTLVSDGKITDEIIEGLTDKESTAKLLGIRYALLKEFDANVPIKELTYIKGSARYSSKPVEINGKEYLITNDLYYKNLLKFMEWAEEVSK